MSKQRKIYVSGPMTGIAEYNFPAFDAAAEDIRSRGWEVISPAELEDLEDYADGVTPEQYRQLLLRDLQLIAGGGVTDIVVLDGWEESGGATAEVALGRALKLPILAYPELHPVEAIDPEPPRVSPLARPTGEVRVTDPKTGGQKGVKPERLDLIPPEPILELARVFGYGGGKYAPHNYLRGYAWGLSIRALEHHILRWKLGRTNDEESGYHHLAHAMWHCMALMMFEWHGLGTDNRICTVVFGTVDSEEGLRRIALGLHPSEREAVESEHG